MNPQALRQIQALTGQVMANVSADQLGDPTPCASWNVAELIDHVIGAQEWARCGVEGVEMAEPASKPSEGDYMAAFQSAADASASAFEVDGAMERTVNPGFGDMPASALLGLAMTDTFTHAWDLAKATGQDTDLAPEVAAQLLAGSRQAIQDGFRGPEGAPFGPEQQAPAGASNADQLAAFLGRTV